MTRISRNSRGRSERGATIIVFAVAITGMLSVSALVLGGSLGYSAVRTAQNGADAAALAGASTLRQVKLGNASPSEVLATVLDVAGENDADTGAIDCDIVYAEYATTNADSDVIGPCNDANVNNALAAGVRVSTHVTRSVPFNAFVDSDTITGDAMAAATIQPVRQGSSPFMVCAAPTATGHPAPVLNPSGTDPSGYEVNTSAIGLEYVLHGNAMSHGGRQCGAGSSAWRGFVAFEGSFPVPSADPNDDSDWWEVKTGNANGHLDRELAGDDACQGDIDAIIGCRIPLPLCPKSNGDSGVNLRLFCVKMGAFEITYNQHSTGTPPCNSGVADNGLVCGKFLGAATVNSGRGGADTPDNNSVVVIKLVQ